MNSQIVTRQSSQKAKIQTRAMIKSVTNRKPNLALLEAKKKAKILKMKEQKTDQQTVVKDVFQNAINSLKVVRGDTGIIYDEAMADHACLWDQHYPERPERFIRVLQRCKELKLIERCKPIPSRRATKQEILLRHSEEHYNLLKSTDKQTNADELEKLCSHYDCVFIHPTTFHLSLLASGSTIDLVKAIVSGEVQNGMAIIRPPGHHAMKSEFNGYCFFNNVAIAAQYAIDELKLKKILIVDWDVHHGQGIQRFFYDDPRVLYFSIHRFEHGEFWPNLKESDFDAIGEGAGKGYNFNLPLNKKGMTNGDYLAIFQQILTPVALEYQPELIIISAGYDAALGCPEGEMEITPACYPHLLNQLSAVAQSKIAVILEGGYCLESLAEGAALTLRSLLGDPCPILVEDLLPPCDSIQDSILNCIYSHKAFWKCLNIQKTYTLEELNNISPQLNLHKVIDSFIGGPPKPSIFPTRGCYPIQPPDIIKSLENRLFNLKTCTNLSKPKIRVCYVYDTLMLEHENQFEKSHPEQPDRIKKISDRHIEYGLFDRMEKLPSRHANTDELCLAHTRAHVNSIRRSVEKTELREIGEKYNSVYFHPTTFNCATLAAGSILQVVDCVLNRKARSGVCIVRPPGHHAEPNSPQGFCIFNNVAIAAQYAIRDHGLKRILIVDWDVHHGNGTQHIFENNSKVLYISIHRYDNATFFPKSKDADYDVVGSGEGKGFNVNIPWNKKGMGDLEYTSVFQQIIMPIAYEFDPELVIVSAGFDAAIGDPLGGCKITPEAYGMFTHWLSALANGKIILCLEGGYNVNSISYAMTMCTKALLGDPLPSINLNLTNSVAFLSCAETIQNVLSVQETYWKCLKFNVKLPESASNFDEETLTGKMKSLKIQYCGDENKSEQKSTITNSEDAGASGASGSSEPSGSNQLSGNNQFFIKVNVPPEDSSIESNQMFAVIPLKTCPHLSQLKPDETPSRVDINIPCNRCDSTVENWICLLCYSVCCGRYINEHMMYHNVETEHPLALSFSDLSVWCYPCEAYIDNPMLHKYKNLVYVEKFGTELVWSYGSDTIGVV